MKILKNLAVCLAVLALGAVTVKSNEPGTVATTARVRSVKGTATYTINGMAKPLKAGVELPEGASITTGPDSEVYVSVNGVTSAVRIQPETTLAIPKMEKIGNGGAAEHETLLDLKSGIVLGQVKKVTGNSKYEIKTPQGVAGIRGTDFRISVTLLPSGAYTVTFTSITGTVFVTATVGADNHIESVTLHDGQSYTPGSGVVALSSVLLALYSSQINDILITLSAANPTGTLTVRPPFTGGTPPGQESGSGDTGGNHGHGP